MPSNHPIKIDHHPQKGFTLVELMVVLVVLFILITISIPKFTQIIQANRASAEVNHLVSDLKITRTEAIKQGLTVTICASSDQISCTSGTSSWHNGWLIFSDPNGNRIIDSGEDILKIQSKFKSSDTLITTAGLTNSGSISAVSYNRDGFSVNVPVSVTWTLDTTPRNKTATRCLQINVVGKIQTLRSGSGGCL